MAYLRYLAYGSNLHPLRMRQRVPSAQSEGVVQLHGWQLRFHKRGRDGSAKCNLIETGNQADLVHAVVYRIAGQERPALDRVEGLGDGYELHSLKLHPHGKTFLYLASASHIDDSLHPFSWYKAFVVEGARFHGLPRAYVGAIEQADTIADPHAQRHHENIRLLWRLWR